jgi:hypothetical protein
VSEIIALFNIDDLKDWDLAEYIGMGKFSINVQASGLWTVSGAVKLISQIQTQARADIQRVYGYSAKLNQVLEHGFLASDLPVLVEIGFSARSRKV